MHFELCEEITGTIGLLS